VFSPGAGKKEDRGYLKILLIVPVTVEKSNNKRVPADGFSLFGFPIFFIFNS